jgi:hypothetical protein
MCAQRLTCSVLTVCLERSRMNTVKKANGDSERTAPRMDYFFCLGAGRT